MCVRRRGAAGSSGWYHEFFASAESLGAADFDPDPHVPGFHYHQHILTCDGLPLTDIAQSAGTPCYVYSGGLIRARYAELEAAFSGYPHAFHYALKANST